ncbi:hypothetical protein H113_06550 [Trichophyton rubrum MR1459]|nr:hypothetical protein H113_06550 [Trichophyton rubrum MR1459]EZG03683.1 hypothetical protein H106_06347 [Trichophyton rubrum CBS 735.88]
MCFARGSIHGELTFGDYGPVQHLTYQTYGVGNISVWKSVMTGLQSIDTTKSSRNSNRPPYASGDQFTKKFSHRTDKRYLFHTKVSSEPNRAGSKGKHHSLS